MSITLPCWPLPQGLRCAAAPWSLRGAWLDDGAPAAFGGDGTERGRAFAYDCTPRLRVARQFIHITVHGQIYRPAVTYVIQMKSKHAWRVRGRKFGTSHAAKALPLHVSAGVDSGVNNTLLDTELSRAFLLVCFAVDALRRSIRCELSCD